MAVQSCKGRPLVAVMLAIIMLAILGACEQAGDKGQDAASPKNEEAAPTAPGIITGDEPLPAGHPPIEGLEAPATTAGALPSDHSAMLEGEVDPNVRPDDEPEHPPSSGKELNVSIPDSVMGKWASVQLEAVLADGGKKEIRTILGKETELPGSGLTVRAEIFLPAYISDFETIKSVSNDLTNPAVKIRLLKDQQAVAVGWVFQNYPEFNSFKSDLVTFSLLSAEAAE